MDVEAIVDTTTDVIEAVAEQAETAQIIVKNNPIVIAGVLVAGVAAGAIITYLVAKKYISSKYEAILDDELDRTEKLYADRIQNLKNHHDESVNKHDKTTVINTTEVIETKESLKKAEGITTKAGYTAYHRISGDIPSVTELEVSPDFDYEAEEQKRLNHQPYIIDSDTYMQNDDENTQQTLTYYNEDEVLCDEEEEPIRSYLEIIGHDNLRFGYGSGDPKTVYIRNERLGSDYEIVLANASYAKEVCGLQDENEVIHPSKRNLKNR